MKSLKTLLAVLLGCSFAPAQQYVISTVAGLPGVQGYFGDGSAAIGAQLNRPFNVSVDSKNNYYISDIYTHTVRMVTAADGKISTLAGTGQPSFTGDDGPANQATLSSPRGVAADGNGNVYIADTFSGRVRRIDSKGVITTFAGDGTRGYAGDGADAKKAVLWFPSGMAIDSAGNVYVGDYGNSTVRKITPGGAISTLAGTGTWGYSGDGSAAARAAVANPVALAVDGAGNVFIGDTGSNTIRRVGTDGNIRTVLANVTPQSIAVDTAGNIYFVEPSAPVVKKLLPSGSVIAIAGTAQQGFDRDGVPALTSRLNLPSAVAVDAAGRVYVADSNNQVIRLLTPTAFSVGAVTNAASSAQRGIAPGEIVTLFGAGIGPSALTQFTVANGAIGTQLAGVSVTFNGTAAPLIYVSGGLVAAIAPYSLANAQTAEINVSYQGNTSVTTTVPVVAAAPGIFTANATGSGQAAAINQDGTLNGSSNPAKPGSIISVYATGEGQTAPGGVDGQLATGSTLPKPILPVTAQVQGTTALVTYAGAAPTLVAGVMQVNIQIPATIPAGVQSLTLQVGGIGAQTGVTIVVGQ